MPRTVLNSDYTLMNMLQCLPLRSLHSNGEVKQLNRMMSATAVG